MATRIGQELPRQQQGWLVPGQKPTFSPERPLSPKVPSVDKQAHPGCPKSQGKSVLREGRMVGGHRHQVQGSKPPVRLFARRRSERMAEAVSDQEHPDHQFGQRSLARQVFYRDAGPLHELGREMVQLWNGRF